VVMGAGGVDRRTTPRGQVGTGSAGWAPGSNPTMVGGRPLTGAGGLRSASIGRTPPTQAPGTGLALGGETRPTARLAVKRVIDVVGALVLLTVCLPVVLFVAALIRLDDSGPVLFRQIRVGRHRKPFRICKFRTMRPTSEAELADLLILNEAEPPLFKVADDRRVTRVGRLLRRSSLDELPQLWNVLLGHMSLVGPRPPLPREVLADAVHQDLRLALRPGMTGLWQVTGRSTIPYSQMVQLDLHYVQRWSLRLDAWILVRTLGAVMGGKGAY
jgi:lipopolysaccharide/colanic/teichoic acid biosynthesis glycosyltransferase